jgi:hypothetical protein
MSLVQGHWVVLGAAGALALGVPMWLLQAGPRQVVAPPPPVVTRLEIVPVTGTENARATPIFSPSRSPLAAAPDPEAASALAQAASRPPPVLVGLVSRARGKGVALVRRSDGQTVTLSPGQSVDGWVLASVRRDRATFRSNGERRDVSLDFSNKVPAASTAPTIPLPTPDQSGTPSPSPQSEPEL